MRRAGRLADRSSPLSLTSSASGARPDRRTHRSTSRSRNSLPARFQERRNQKYLSTRPRFRSPRQRRDTTRRKEPDGGERLTERRGTNGYIQLPSMLSVERSCFVFCCQPALNHRRRSRTFEFVLVSVPAFLNI